jgi:outer membrane protein TolC
VGFREGVMTVTNVMEAQTAWQKAETQRIDAQIDVVLAEIALKHAVGRE